MVSSSALLIFVLLGPGFLFFTGLYTGGRLTRDDNQHGAIFDAAALVVASVVLHTVFAPVFFLIVEKYCASDILSPIIIDKLPDPVKLTTLKETKILWYMAYFIISSFCSFILGHFAIYYLEQVNTRKKIAGFIDAGILHGPYLHMVQGKLEPLVFVSILTDVSADNRFVMYNGFVEDIAFMSFKKINYICLAFAQRKIFKIDENFAYVASDEDDRLVDDLTESHSDPMYLVITGDKILNFAFRAFGVVQTPASDRPTG